MQDSRYEEDERRWAREDRIHKRRMEKDPVYRKKSESDTRREHIRYLQGMLNNSKTGEMCSIIYFNREDYKKELKLGTISIPEGKEELFWFLTR